MGVLIYGAGVYGTLAKKILEKQGVHIIAFVDRKLKGKEIEGVYVISPDIVAEYNEHDFYIATRNYYSEIKKYLYSQGCSYVKDLRKVYECDVTDLNLTHKEKDIWERRGLYNDIVEADNISGITIGHIEVTVTEKCNLRCKNCSNLMPYYSNPQNANMKKNIVAIHNLLANIEYLGEIRLLGGEPFLNPNLTEIISEFSHHEKVGSVTIYTNGTIIPNKNVLECIKQNNVMLHISDYGIANEKRELLIQKCEENDIRYSRRVYDEWYDYGTVTDNQMSVNEIENMFRHCASAYCHTMINGQLFRCPREAHMYNMGLVDGLKACRLDFYNNDVSKKDIEEFLYNLQYIEACRYCYSINDESRKIKAAIQIPKNVRVGDEAYF